MGKEAIVTLIARAGRVLAVIAVAALAAACASEAEGPEAGRPESTVTPPGAEEATTTSEAAEGIPDAARAYFEAFATDDLSRMGAMLDASVEGSPAALYATHQIAFTRAIGPGFGTTVDASDTEIVLTATYFDLSGNEVDESTTYADFAVEGDKLAGFTVDGVPIADRIRGGAPEGTSGDGVTVRIVTAYQTARGDLALNVDIANGRESVVEIADYEWSLVTPDGRQVGLNEELAVVPPSVEPGATAGHIVVYEQVGLGGTLRFVAFADDFATEIRFDVAVPS